MLRSISTQLMAAPVKSGNVFDTITNMGTDATDALLVIGGVVAILFVILMAWKSGGALGAVITALLSAAIFVWALNNLGSSGVQGQIGDTINGAPSHPTITTTTATVYLEAA